MTRLQTLYIYVYLHDKITNIIYIYVYLHDKITNIRIYINVYIFMTRLHRASNIYISS